MSVRTYSPKDTILNVNGSIISGYADGSFLTVAREVEAYTKVTGADGEVSRTKSANKSGSITLTLKQTSNSNAILGALAKADEEDDSGVFDIQCKDNLGNIMFSAEGWVQKVPDHEFAAELSNREWIIDCSKVVFTFPEVEA